MDTQRLATKLAREPLWTAEVLLTETSACVRILELLNPFLQWLWQTLASLTGIVALLCSIISVFPLT
jgi:hypothetical protein